MESFFQFEAEATEKSESLRERGFDVVTTAYEGGHALAISGPPELMEALAQEVMAERRSKPPRVLTGTVRWWKDERATDGSTATMVRSTSPTSPRCRWTVLS